MRICVSSKTKYISVKEFNVITERNKAKKWRNILHVIVNANSIVQNVIQIKNGIIKHANVDVKIIKIAKNIIVRILVQVSNSEYQKSIVDDSQIACDEIVYVMDIVSTKITNTLTTNVMSIMLTN